MPGGAEKQKEARSTGEAFKLNAWEHEKGAAFYNKHLRNLLPHAWRVLVERYPVLTDKMLAALPRRYRLEGTGFSKCTVALNNPTPLHYDDQNFGLTFLIAFDVGASPLAPGSGSHVLCGMDMQVAVQVRDRATGVVTLGDYRRVLHANRAVHGNGERLIVTAYCSQALVNRVSS